MWLVFVMVWLGLSMSEAIGQTDLNERLKYHFSELSNGLQEWKTHAIHKRSATPDYNAMLFHSWTSFCSQLSSESSSNPQVLPQQSLRSVCLPAPKKFTYDDVSKWQRPDIFPVKVQAERVGETVWFIFDVIHTAPAYVIRSHSMDPKKTHLDYPEGVSGPVMSKVRLTVNASACDNETIGRDLRYHFIFCLHDKCLTRAQVVLDDVCRFDTVWNDTQVDGIGTVGWTPGHDTIITSNISLPRFKILPDLRNNVMVKRGKNVTFEINAYFFRNDAVNINAELWDWKSGKMLKTGFRINPSFSPPYDIVFEKNRELESSNETILSFEVLEMIKDNELGYDAYRYQNITARIKITVITAVGKRSGRLSIYWRQGKPYDYYRRELVGTATTGREILLERRNKAVFPENFLDFLGAEQFVCDEKGMTAFPKENRHCTIPCSVYGSNIQTIFINKADSNMTPVKSTSYLIGQTAFALIDVGPASPETDGQYTCMVVTKNGKMTKKTIGLHRAFFAKIEQFELKDLENGKVRVTCIASGLQPLSMSIDSFGDTGSPTHLDWIPGIYREETTGDKVKNLTIIVSKHMISHHHLYLNCNADGELGSDAKEINYLDSNRKVI